MNEPITTNEVHPIVRMIQELPPSERNEVISQIMARLKEMQYEEAKQAYEAREENMRELEKKMMRNDEPEIREWDTDR